LAVNEDGLEDVPTDQDQEMAEEDTTLAKRTKLCEKYIKVLYQELVKNLLSMEDKFLLSSSSRRASLADNETTNPTVSSALENVE